MNQPSNPINELPTEPNSRNGTDGRPSAELDSVASAIVKAVLATNGGSQEQAVSAAIAAVEAGNFGQQAWSSAVVGRAVSVVLAAIWLHENGKGISIERIKRRLETLGLSSVDTNKHAALVRVARQVLGEPKRLSVDEVEVEENTGKGEGGQKFNQSESGPGQLVGYIPMSTHTLILAGVENQHSLDMARYRNNTETLLTVLGESHGEQIKRMEKEIEVSRAESARERNSYEEKVRDAKNALSMQRVIIAILIAVSAITTTMVVTTVRPSVAMPATVEASTSTKANEEGRHDAVAIQSPSTTSSSASGASVIP